LSKIIFDSGISLDGFFAGDNRSPKNPMGGVSGQIHSWMFNQKAFWEYLGFEGGKEDGADGKFIRETIERTGAFIMGKRMFEEGEASWPDDLYKADVYVLTHEKREPWVQEGTTTFHFINDGIRKCFGESKTISRTERHKNTRWGEHNSTISKRWTCRRIFHSHCTGFFRRWHSTV
jgi:dihydrofolate reductase